LRLAHLDPDVRWINSRHPREQTRLSYGDSALGKKKMLGHQGLLDFGFTLRLCDSGSLSEAAGMLRHGEEKVFRREYDASSAESFAELKPQVVSNVGLLTFRRHYCAKILSAICFAFVILGE
jgi:hypothetical protein